MAIKNLGHYVGEVEDIDVNSIQFRLLQPLHREAIKLSIARNVLTNELKEIDERINQIRDELMPFVDEFDWLWIWTKKRTSVKWKEEFVKALGQPKADAIVKQYKTKSYPQLGIKYVDPIPDSIEQVKSNPPKFPIVKHKLK